MRFPSLAGSALVFLLLNACAAGANPVVDTKIESDLITARLDTLVTAEKAFFAKPSLAGAKTAAAFYADDAIVQPADEPATQGRDKVESLYQMMMASGPMQMESTMKTIAVAASGDIAWQTGSNMLTAGGTTMNGKYLAVWKKVNGQWMVAAISFSNDAPANSNSAPPPPAKK